jgi:tetratricopeptide (TPR) repeat protein
MRRLPTLLALLLAAGSTAVAAPGDAPGLFASGNEAYVSGRYDEAAGAYRQLLSQGVDTAAVRYNLGASLYRLGQLGPAILEMEKAARHAPQDPDIAASLEFLGSLTLDRTTGSSARTTTFFVERLLAFSTPGQDAAAFAVGWILAGLVLALYQFSISHRARRAAVWALAILGLPLALLAGSVVLKTWLEASRRQAVVLAEKADVRSGPDEENTTLFTIHEGLKVRLRGSQGSWARISLENGLSGWVESDTLGAI